MSKWIKKLSEAYAEVNEKKHMDPVDQSALKGSHKDRKDKDIDNDGDVDKSDEYLHNRRKTVKKAMSKEGDIEMNPKKKEDKKAMADTMEAFKKGDAVTPSKGPHKGQQHKIIHDFGDGHYNISPHNVPAKLNKYRMGAAKAHKSDLKKMTTGVVKLPHEKNEDTLPPVYARIMENREREKHMKGATPPEGMHDKSKSSKGAMDMLNTPKEIVDNPESEKLKNPSKQSPLRKGDNAQKDSMQAPKDTTKAA
jgi:hypothetical protein